MRADTLRNGLHPRPRVFVGRERHRRHPLGPMTGLALLLEDRRDVLREGRRGNHIRLHRRAAKDHDCANGQRAQSRSPPHPIPEHRPLLAWVRSPHPPATANILAITVGNSPLFFPSGAPMDGLASLRRVPADDSRITFDDITAPIGRDRFLSEYWARQGVHLRQGGRTFDNIFGWDGLDAILNAHDLAFPQVKMSRADSPIPAERFTSEAAGRPLVDSAALVDLFRDGASFGITG